MARTNVPVSQLAWNGVIDIPAGTNIDQVNGMNFAPPAATAIPSAPSLSEAFLYVTNTAGADKTVTIRAGVGGGATPGQAFRAGLGDLVVTVHTASGGGVIGPLESARFAQLDGSINIDFQAGLTGKITAFVRPKSF